MREEEASINIQELRWSEVINTGTNEGLSAFLHTSIDWAWGKRGKVEELAPPMS
ncbi:hypothetical protein D3C71_2140690 [compost metagenome]